MLLPKAANFVWNYLDLYSYDICSSIHDYVNRKRSDKRKAGYKKGVFATYGWWNVFSYEEKQTKMSALILAEGGIRDSLSNGMVAITCVFHPSSDLFFSSKSNSAALQYSAASHWGKEVPFKCVIDTVEAKLKLRTLTCEFASSLCLECYFVRSKTQLVWTSP